MLFSSDSASSGILSSCIINFFQFFPALIQMFKFFSQGIVLLLNFLSVILRTCSVVRSHKNTFYFLNSGIGIFNLLRKLLKLSCFLKA